MLAAQTIHDTMAAALRLARTRSHLTQTQLAERMGTSQSTVGRLEAGGRWPSPDTISRWMGATGTASLGALMLDAERGATS